MHLLAINKNSKHDYAYRALVDIKKWGSAKSLARDLFTRYMVVVQLAGVLLTAAVIGAVVIARKPEAQEGSDLTP